MANGSRGPPISSVASGEHRRLYEQPTEVLVSGTTVGDGGPVILSDIEIAIHNTDD